MNHELLLALSGHPSPLFPSTLESHQRHDGAKHVDDGFPLTSSSETALLESVGSLALLHRQTRTHTQRIVSEHPSTICRAVASALLHTHLVRFQKKVLDVENHILNKDASIVGAYNIVPLSAVVGEFGHWRRRMVWYWKVASYIQGPGRSSSGSRSTGAALIDYLRAESQTGFPDVEVASNELAAVAEKAWLKQLSAWLLYGQLPSHGASDFFVNLHESSEAEGLQIYGTDNSLLPNFVSRHTAASLLFVGKTLHQVKRHRQGTSVAVIGAGEDAILLADHLNILSSLNVPLVPSVFSTAIASIRSSLSQKVLQKLLPIEDIKIALSTFQDFFLLGRGDFATTLIAEAQKQLSARRGDLGSLRQDDPARNLRGVMIKEGEVSETLTRTWKSMTATQVEDVDDVVLEFARENLHLEISNTTASRSSTSEGLNADVLLATNVVFNDMLFPVPTSLALHIPQPVDLFVSRSDVAHYARITSYLLALRQSHMRLSDLWRLSAVRRDDPKASWALRQRVRSREVAMRKLWATCSAAVFLLSEMTAYLEGEVIKGSWQHFLQWTTKGASGTPHDPEALSSAHRLFISTLMHVLLLNDEKFTRILRTLLGNIDYLIAHFLRLQQLQRSMDLDLESGITSSHAGRDEQHVTLELDRSRKRVDSGMKDLLARLRELDYERLGDAAFRGLQLSDDSKDAQGFEPWRGGGIERLLMKLDFGRVMEDDIMFSR